MASFPETPEETGSDKIRDVHAVTHRLRYKILLLIEESPSYTRRICRELSVNPRLVRFHLTCLRRRGIVEHYHDITDDPFGPYAAAYHRLTEKGENLLEQIRRPNL